MQGDLSIRRLPITTQAARVYAHKWHSHRNAIGGIYTEILQRQCGKERIYVESKSNNNDNSTSRRGGYKRRKGADVKLVVISVYVGEKPMKDVIGNAITDSFMRMEEIKEITA